MESLLVHTQNNIEIIPCADIIRIEASGSYSKIYITKRKCIIASKNLANTYKQLCPNNFIKVHRSHIINIKYILRVNKILNKIELSNGESLPVSKSHLDKLISNLTNIFESKI